MSPLPPHLRYRRLTSLDKSRFSVDPSCTHLESQDYAMCGEGNYRSHIISALTFLGRSRKSITRYAECCLTALVSRNVKTKKLRIQFETCGSRYCPNCSYRYRRDLAERIIKRIGIVKPKVWRFLTLTIRSTDEPLGEQLDNLRTSFRRLRQTVLWLSTQLLGYAVIEITFNEMTQKWHPHLHVLTRGIYLDQRKLSEQWKKCSRGSDIVDVRMIRNGRHAVNYICKYLGKSPEFGTMTYPVERAIEYLDALRNRKMVIGYGINMISESHDLPTEIPPATLDWIPLISLQKLITGANNGNRECRKLFAELNGILAQTSQPTFIDDG